MARPQEPPRQRRERHYGQDRDLPGQVAELTVLRSLALSPLVDQGIVTSRRKPRSRNRQVGYAGFPGRGQVTVQPALNGATSGFMPE
jgi:hypothetical protein